MGTVTKVMSMESSSGAPTPPLPTPKTEVLGELDREPETDLMAVSQTLAPIQEELNDAAEHAMYPTPPINTPEVFSPAPSVIVRQQHRSRGLSALGDRLTQLSMHDRVLLSNMDKDESSSVRSGNLSVDEDRDGAINFNSPSFSASGSIPIAMGSPALNPRINEYLAHRSPGISPIGSRFSEMEVIKEGKSGDGSHDDGDGVTEKSNWSEEVIGDLDRAIMRLEQLADDEGAAGGQPAEQFFFEHLIKVLGGSDRKYPVKPQKLYGFLA